MCEAEDKLKNLEAVHAQCCQSLLMEIHELRVALEQARETAYAGWVAATGYPIAEWVYEYEQHAWLRAYVAERHTTGATP